jgi:TPR repeat protein
MLQRRQEGPAKTTQGFALFELAAAGGCVDAMFNLGYSLKTGNGAATCIGIDVIRIGVELAMVVVGCRS